MHRIIPGVKKRCQSLSESDLFLSSTENNGQFHGQAYLTFDKIHLLIFLKLHVSK